MSGNYIFEGGITGISRQRINNAAAAGDTTVVPAVAGKTVRVYGMRISASAATVVQVKDGAGNVLEVFNFSAAGTTVLGIRGTPYYLTTQGNALVINSSAAVQVDGMVDYSQAGA